MSAPYGGAFVIASLAKAYALTLVSADCSLAKRVTVVDGVVTKTDDPLWPRLVALETIQLATIDDLLDVLSGAAGDDPAPCVVRAEPLTDVGRRAIYDDPEKGPAGLRIMPRAWVGYDIEKVSSGGFDPLHEPARAVAKARCCLPPPHHDTTVVWQITASAGKRQDELRLRLWFLLDRPLLGRQVEAWCRPGIDSGWLDPCTLRNEVLPHFIAIKVVGNSPDPCLQRWGLIRGERDAVPVPDGAMALPVHTGFDGHFRADDVAVLTERYGLRRLKARRSLAVAKIKAEIEAVRSSAAGARHPRYLKGAATIKGICAFWGIPLERPRQLLEDAYLSTLAPHEAKKRERGSTHGVWSWLGRRPSG
jgi:hypothetical protein